MAALSGITAVRPTANTKVGNPVTFGGTIAVGAPVYKDSADSKYKLGDNNASAATADVKGLALTPGVADGLGYVATEGSVILVGTTMTVGLTYYLGATAGEIVPEADLTTGNRVTRLGTAASATQLDLSIRSTGIVRA